MAWKSDDDIGVIDVFCGIGGLTHGFYKEGVKIIAGVDVDPSCRYAFETNNHAPFINKSIEEVSSKEVSDLFGKIKVKVLVGCAPCQPFSTYNRKKDGNGEWKLLREFSRLVSESEPDVVSMENVPQIMRHDIFKWFVNELKRLGYHVYHDVVFCPDYGVPQRRRRLVLLASKFGEIALIEKTHRPENYKKVRDAIGKLRPLKCGEVDRKDPLHRCRDLTALNLMRIRSTPEGGGWENWDDKLKLECHKKETGHTFRAVYGRMKWDALASTITTEFINLGSGRFGHPVQDRAISIREAALLQTFPKYYEFFDDESEITFETMARHIGNAVPVRLGKVIARSIRNHVKSHIRQDGK